MASRLSIFPPISIFKSLKVPFSLIYRLKRLHVCTKFDFPGCLLRSKSILELDISEVREKERGSGRERERDPILENKTRRSEESNEKFFSEKHRKRVRWDEQSDQAYQIFVSEK